MKIANDSLNPYVEYVEDAQGEIRLLVKRAYLQRLPENEVNEALKKIVRHATRDVKIDRLKGDIIRSLINYANRQRRLWSSLGISPEALLFLGSVQGKEQPPTPPQRVLQALPQYRKEMSAGVPLQRYYKDVWREKIKPTLERIAAEKALDPTDIAAHNSLRNLAEMEVRYRDHIDEIAELKSAGTKLVVCSAHTDCSDRCAPWQGRVYSLDGTSGTTPDGHRYVPLEEATDHYYTTKAGRTYKNGLLGFNCRHKITEYKGKMLPVVGSRERKREYAITQRQRTLERKVRNAKAEMEVYKGIDRVQYLSARRKAIEYNKQYKQYSRDSNRAFYPVRTKIT